MRLALCKAVVWTLALAVTAGAIFVLGVAAWSALNAILGR